MPSLNLCLDAYSFGLAAMAQQQAAAALANLLSKVARYSVILGIGGSALQASLYTGAHRAECAGHASQDASVSQPGHTAGHVGSSNP